MKKKIHQLIFICNTMMTFDMRISIITKHLYPSRLISTGRSKFAADANKTFYSFRF